MIKCKYDYEDKCDCADDDNCGCSYPNNMPHDVECKGENYSLSDVHIFKRNPTNKFAKKKNRI